VTEEDLNRRVVICNPKGLHARPASKVAKLAQCYDATISVRCNGETAEADSIMDLLMLGAAPGAELFIDAYGPQATMAVDAIANLIARGFDEI